LNFHAVDVPNRLPLILVLAAVSLLSLAGVGEAVYDYEIAAMDLNTPAPPGPPPLPTPFRHVPHVQAAQPQDYGNCYDPSDPCRQRLVNLI
jgi:hypothetical protein